MNNIIINNITLNNDNIDTAITYLELSKANGTSSEDMLKELCNILLDTNITPILDDIKAEAIDFDKTEEDFYIPEGMENMEVRAGWLVTVNRDEVESEEERTIDCYWYPTNSIPSIGDEVEYWNIIGKPRYGKITNVDKTLVPKFLYGGAYLAEPKEEPTIRMIVLENKDGSREAYRFNSDDIVWIDTTMKLNGEDMKIVDCYMVTRMEWEYQEEWNELQTITKE